MFIIYLYDWFAAHYQLTVCYSYQWYNHGHSAFKQCHLQLYYIPNVQICVWKCQLLQYCIRMNVLWRIGWTIMYMLCCNESHFDGRPWTGTVTTGHHWIAAINFKQTMLFQKNCFERRNIDWLTVYRHISTKRLLVPRNNSRLIYTGLEYDIFPIKMFLYMPVSLMKLRICLFKKFLQYW